MTVYQTRRRRAGRHRTISAWEQILDALRRLLTA